MSSFLAHMCLSMPPFFLSCPASQRTTGQSGTSHSLFPAITVSLLFASSSAQLPVNNIDCRGFARLSKGTRRRRWWTNTYGKFGLSQTVHENRSVFLSPTIPLCAPTNTFLRPSRETVDQDNFCPVRGTDYSERVEMCGMSLN